MIRLDLLARLKKIGEKTHPILKRNCLKARTEALRKRGQWYKLWVKILERKSEDDQIKKIEELESKIMMVA